MKNEIVLFNDGDLEIEVSFTPEQETVWLTLDQISELFDRDKSVISRHIYNIFKEEELSREVVVAKNAITTQHGAIPGKTQTHYVDHYNLDVIISVGYRIKSSRGTKFRKWANAILKDYILKGYAINEKRLETLNKTIEIQSKMLASASELEGEDVYKVVTEYTRALDLLDDYDHQCLDKPKGSNTLYHLSYEECRKLIDSIKFSSDVFGVEKEKGKLNGILEAVY